MAPSRSAFFVDFAICLALLPVVSTLRAAGTPSDEYKAAVQHANEVSALSDRIYAAQLKLQRTQNSYHNSKRYYDSVKDNLKDQIRIRKSMASNQHGGTDESTYRQKQEEHYKSVLCSICLDAFVYDETDAKRVHVLEICMGRKSLGDLHLLQLEVGPATNVSAKSWPSPSNLTAIVASVGTELQALFAIESHLENEGVLKGGPGTHGMQQQLQQLQSEEQAVAAQLASDRAQWRAEVEELREEEQSLAAAYSDQHFDREAMKEEAFVKAKSELCPIINGNYGINEQAIDDSLSQECVAILQ